MAQDSDSPRRPEKSRGRRRDPGRTEAILDAAIKQLLEVGYDHFRIQDVALRAGCGTGTIYRRWSSKEALAAEAIRNMKTKPAELSDDPVADLRRLIRSECDGHANKPDRVPGLIAAMRAHPDIGAAVREGYSLESYRQGIARVIGEDHPQLSLLSELVPSVCLLRASFAPETLDAEAMTEELLALIVAIASADG